MPKQSNNGAYRLVRLENGKLRGVGDLRATVGSDETAVLQSVLLVFEQQAGGGDNSLAVINLKLALMYALKPQDELEGLLIAQMINVHGTAHDYLLEGSSDKNLQSVRLFHLFIRQMEYLQQHRSRGKGRRRESIPQQLESENTDASTAALHNGGTVRQL